MRNSKKKLKLKLILLFTPLLIVIATQYQSLIDWYNGYIVYCYEPGFSAQISNDKGQTIGIIYPTPISLSSNREQQAAFYNPATSSLRTLTSPDKDWPICRPEAINLKGIIVGTIVKKPEQSFVTQAILWEDEIPMETFSLQGNRYLQPRDINNSNEVVGFSYKVKTIGQVSMYIEQEAFYWSKTKGIISLKEQLGFKVTTAKEINNSGMVIGDYVDKNQWKSYYFYKGKVHPIDIPNKKGTKFPVMARNINNRGEVLVQEVSYETSILSDEDNLVGIWTPKQGFRKINGTKDITIVIGLGIDDQSRLLIEGVENSTRYFYIYDSGKLRKLPEFNSILSLQYHSFTENGWLAGTTGDMIMMDLRGFVLKLIR